MRSDGVDAQSWRGSQLELRFADRQVDERRGQRQRDVRVPHPREIAEGRERLAAEPRAEEPADLVRERREAEQRREITHAEQLADEPGGRRHGGEPGEAQHRGEHIERERGLGRGEVDAPRRRRG